VEENYKKLRKKRRKKKRVILENFNEVLSLALTI
jgi:hypothetical protein